MRLADFIRSRAFTMLVVALTLTLGGPASASDTLGVEVIVGAPKVFASVVSGAERSWIVTNIGKRQTNRVADKKGFGSEWHESLDEGRAAGGT